jgi:hypothetical protein
MNNMSNLGPVGIVPSVEDIQQRINDTFDDLFHYDLAGNRHAYVCSFCDEFLISAYNRFFVPQIINCFGGMNISKTNPICLHFNRLLMLIRFMIGINACTVTGLKGCVYLHEGLLDE